MPSTRSSAVGIFFLLGAQAGAARAEEQKRPLDSTRALARGGTYVAAYDSDEATRQNPATLAESAVKFQLRWLQLDVVAGRNTVNTARDVMDVASGKGGDGPLSLLEKFEDKFGERQYSRIQVSPVAIRVLSFEFAPFVSSANLVDVRIPTMPVATVDSDSRLGASIAWATNIGKELNVGVALKPQHRTTYRGEIAFSDIPTFIDDEDAELSDVIEKREGFQVALDAGAIWRPGKAWRFGLTMESIGYAGNFSEFDDPPAPQPMKVSLGGAYRVDWKPWFWDFAVDIQDVVNPQHYHPLRLIHLGSEIGRTYVSRDTDAGFLLGLNEGYGTVGAYLDVLLARLGFSYYAVELGEYPGQRADRRYGVTVEIATTL